jgi:hypothetical protein
MGAAPAGGSHQTHSRRPLASLVPPERVIEAVMTIQVAIPSSALPIDEGSQNLEPVMAVGAQDAR